MAMIMQNGKQVDVMIISNNGGSQKGYEYPSTNGYEMFDYELIYMPINLYRLDEEDEV